MITFRAIDLSAVSLEIIEALMPLFTDLEISETDYQMYYHTQYHSNNRSGIGAASEKSDDANYGLSKPQFLEKMRVLWKSDQISQ